MADPSHIVNCPRRMRHFPCLSIKELPVALDSEFEVVNTLLIDDG
jgi:hypothetical protein